MKFLALILSIYIFGLNFVPCEDTGAVEDEIKTEISQGLDSYQQHQDADLCSPFCQCHCCQMHISNVIIKAFRFTNPHISTEVFHYNYGVVKDFNAAILQPPRV